ncbi:MAG: hypothetical protein FJW49_02775 [Actinobacteria bacterium]|nr:hypothetical protein [Actinomycetota bacterium]
MEERVFLQLWNQKRLQIIIAQIGPTIVLIPVLVLAAQGTFASANDAAGYLAIAVVAATGFLGIVSQYAAIREAQALLLDMNKVTNPTALTQKVASSSKHLSLTALAVVGLGLITFASVVLAVMG